MSLPTIKVPEYKMELPSNGKEMKYRPFLVKEEKVLHVAMESGDSETMVDAISRVVSSCFSMEESEVREMPLFDLEYCFLQIRSKSVGEVATPSVKCSECGNVYEVDVDVSEIGIEKDEKHSTNIELSDGVGVMMKYPSLGELGSGVANDSSSEAALDILIDCIDKVYDSENVHDRKDFSRDDIEEFVEGLTKDNFEKISNFFETMPKTQKKVEHKCPNCGHEDEIDIEGIENFFG